MTDLAALVRGLGSPRVVVVGDLMLDRYVFGTVSRISPEAPIPVLRVRREEERPGAAACVASNLRALGATVELIGFVGDDASGRRLRMLLEASSIGNDGVLLAKARPTTLKMRMLASGAHHNQQILRVDREHVDEFPTDDEDRLFAAYERAIEGASCVVVSDYAKGVVSRPFVRRVIDRARAAGVPVVVDPKGTDYDRYAGATVVTPNRNEARQATGIDLSDRESIAAAGRQLRTTIGCDWVVVKVDKDGMALVGEDADVRFVQSTPREVFDVTGAGDMVAAMLGLALAEGCPMEDAARLANIAAGVEVGKVGAVAVTRDEILEALGQGLIAKDRALAVDELLAVLEKRRAASDRIVFTNGCFDVLHMGHAQYLRFAREQGDLLVVGLNSDASVQRLKGAERPVNPEQDRAGLLLALGCVDYVVVFGEDTPLELITAVDPNVLVKGEDWRDRGVVGREVVEARGGTVVLAPLLAGRSTTNVLERARAAQDSVGDDSGASQAGADDAGAGQSGAGHTGLGAIEGG